MIIAMVSEHASPLAVLGGVDSGGQNVYVAALARACARLGHRVIVYTRRDDPALPTRVRFAPNVDVVHVRAGPPAPIPKDDIYPYIDEMAVALFAEWAADTPDIVHAHFWMSGLAAMLAANPLGVPVVQTFHALGRTKQQWQGDRDTSPSARVEEEAYLARAVDRLIATARHEMFDLRAMGAPRRRISVVPCGVDLARFRPDDRPNDGQLFRRRILCVSRLVERKGIDTVIEALADVPDAELVIAGGPELEELRNNPEAGRLADRSRAVGVADRVAFVGRVTQDDLPALYRSAAVVACTPWYEPFGMVAVEAMACGIPAVVTNVGGLVDSVVDGVTGLHVPPRDPVALAAAIRALLDAPERRAQMGAHGAERAHKHYGWDSIAGHITRVYTTTRQRVGRQRRYA